MTNSEKKCCHCLEFKSLDQFHKRTRASDGLTYRCKLCFSVEYAERYKQNKNNRSSTIKAAAHNTYKRNRLFVFEHLKKSECVDCGETDPVVLEFDHIDPSQKIEAISVLCRRTVSIETLQEEINKCEVRCANCHRRRTAKQFRWYADLQ